MRNSGTSARPSARGSPPATLRAVRLAAPLRSILLACLVSTAAWWTTLFFWRSSPEWSHSPLLLALASLVGFGATGWLWAGETRTTLAPARLSPRDLPLVLLLAPAWLSGLALERVVRAALGGPPPLPVLFEWSPAFAPHLVAASALMSLVALE